MLRTTSRLFVACCLIHCGIHAEAATIYVDASGTSTAPDGASWATAFQDLKAALSNAQTGDEIWVTAGVYNPGLTPFKMKPGVDLYGGFSGSETTLESRDWELNQSILSGSQGAVDDWDDNAPILIEGEDDAILDGFTVTRAASQGMVNDHVSPTVRHCHFLQIGTYGIVNKTSDAIVDSCTFEEIGPGGGITNDGFAAPLIVDCDFINNTAVTCSAGLYLDSGSSGHVLRCYFENNTGPLWGGAINVNTNWGGTPLIEECIFIENSAQQGGAFWLGPGGDATLKNCYFEGNTSTGAQGGAVWVEGADLLVEGCEFLANDASGFGSGGAIYDANSSNAFSSADSVTTIKDCVFNGNAAGLGGAISIDSDSTVSNCTFSGNTAFFGGAVYVNDRDNETIDIHNCSFSENEAFIVLNGSTIAGYGDAIYNESISHLSISNCILSGGVPSGVAISNDTGCSPAIAYSNIQGGNGSGASWNALLGTDGGGNIDSDPLFVTTPDDGGDGWKDDPATVSVDESANNDYGVLRLLASSLCIDAGDGDKAPSADLYGSNRQDDPIASDTGTGVPAYTDMGAIEFLPADANGDGYVSQADLDVVLLNWGATVTPGDRSMGDYNGDGVVSQLDLNLVNSMWGQGQQP